MDDNFEEDNLVQDEPIQLTKKEKAEEASHDVAEVAARGLGRYFGGAVGGAAVDAALNTKMGQAVLKSASKKVAHTPFVKGSLARSYGMVSKAKPIAHKAIDHLGATKVDSNSSINSKVGLSSSQSSSGGEGSVVSKKSNKAYMMVIYIICSIVAFLAFVCILLLIICVPLMVLGIIDIGDITNSGGFDYSSNIYIQKIENDCSSIIVEGVAVNLEDYVAGVVSAEAYTGEGMEALKAQAIAARTYAIVRTNNCQKSIRNSSYDQNYSSNISDRARQATEETKGLVLTYNSQLFSSEYDSFYNKGDYNCDSNGCYVTYKKLPNSEKHVVEVSSSYKGYIAGGHGRGMSQVASYDMAKKGYNFDYILKYFYSPGVTISSLSGEGGYTDGNSGSAANFIVRTTMPSSSNDNDKKYYFSNENTLYSNGSVGQSTWYAFGRANELLAQSDSDLKWSITSNAKYWYDNNINLGANAFSYSNDVNEPKVGAIIVWNSDQFGHVGIVEKVNSDGTLDYTEVNIDDVKNETNEYGFRYQSNISYTETGEGTISNIWNGYDFVGYIYIVE